MATLSIDTPIGALCITETDDAITALGWSGTGADRTPLLTRARDQIHAYFDGQLTEFDLPLRVAGSDLQRAVCDAMAAIPFGETRTYGDIARELGVPAQAIGQACGGNPIPVIIPCHRVLGANGLGGFSGGIGIETKVALLRLEGAAGLLI